MQLSQKSRYALRAVFELSRHKGHSPIKVADIARAQDIPVRFLEIILNHLKQADFVESRRGSEGGYLLIREPKALTVGEVLHFTEGSLWPVDVHDPEFMALRQLRSEAAFSRMWSRAEEALALIYDGTTFQDLLNEDHRLQEAEMVNYSI